MEKSANKLIGLMIDQNPNQLVGLLGVLKSGCGFVPMDPDYPSERIDYMARDSRIDTLVTEARHLPKVLRISGGAHPLKHIICLDRITGEVAVPDGVSVYDLEESQAEPEPVCLPNNVGPGRVAYIVYTSGSTGKPKGVPITHENLFPLLQWSQQYFGYGERTRTLQSLSFCFDFGIYEVLTTAALGGTLYFIDKSQKLDPHRYAEFVNRYAIDTIHSTPSFFSELAGCGCRLEPLEQLHLGGEALMASAVDQIFNILGEGCSINNWYGPSETTVNSSFFEVGTKRARAGNGSVTVPIGKASAKNTLFILDRNGNLMPEGAAGELYIGGPGLAPGYLNRPELTAERFIPSPFDEQPGAQLYKTGDLVRRLPGGHVEFLGRLDHQVKVRGFRIELGEIEAALAEHDEVREVVVLALEDRPGSKRLVAYLVPEQEPGPTSGELRSFLKQQLPDYMVPSAFVTLEAMPLNQNGKLDRKALPLPAGRSALGDDFVVPRTAAEEVIAGICAEVLGLDQLGVNDNFFDLGCHSLLATKIVLRLRESFGVDMPLVRLFESPTVAGLAECLEAEGQGGERLEIPTIQPVPRDTVIPLSFAQERVWFLSELDPASVSYHVPRALRIKGRFSVSVLQQSFGELIRRHEILRTAFPKVDGRPVQVIQPPSPIEARVYNLRALPEAEQEECIQNHILAEGRRPFDLTSGRLLKLSVLQLGDDRHVFVLTEHHLVHDGWTQGVLIGDFLHLYKAMSEGRPSPLPELPVQYADFAYWQRQWLQSEVLDRQLDYWKQRLAGAPPVLDVPADRPRPAVQSFRGAEYPLVISGELAESLRALSRREGVTLFMTMLAAFKTLLYRYTSREDMVVGSWVANRQARETEGLLGMIINTIVLRTDLSGNPGFRELLKRCREICLGAYAHQDMPFERLVEELQPQRSLSYNPLFQVLFAFQDTATPTLELPGMSMEVMEAHNQSAKFDLNVVVLPHREQLVGLGATIVDDEITVLIEYSTDLFNEETIRRMATHYKVLMESAVKAESRSISAMDMLTPEERQQMLVEWNATREEYPAQLSATDLFQQQVGIRPDSVALVCANLQLSYSHLNSLANRLALLLLSSGTRPDSLVGLCLARGPLMLVSLLGVLKAGAAYLPLDPAYPQARLSYMLDDSGAALLIADRDLTELLAGREARVMRLDQLLVEGLPEAGAEIEAGATGDNLAYVIYTSGSTGGPKGVAVERRGLTNLLVAMQRRLGADETCRLVAVTSLSFDIAMLELLLPLVSGGKVVVARGEQIGDGQELRREVARQQASCMQATPSGWMVMTEAGWEGEAGMKVLCGGEALGVEQSRRLKKGGVKVWNMYGPTETTIWSSMWEVEEGAEKVLIGRPIMNTAMYVKDGRQEEVGVGVRGELYIGGEGVARCYLGEAGKTAERFVPDGSGEREGGRLYRTGDVVKYEEGGEIEYLGRIDEQVKVRGYRIEMGEIEAALEEDERVKQAAVVARQERGADRRLVAYYVAEEGAGRISVKELREHLKQRLPEYMMPQGFVELEEMPLTANGKLDRRALPEAEENEGGQEGEEASTAVEEIVGGIWGEVLGMERVGKADNFFELGGHSLLATQVISRVREALEVEVPLKAMFERPSLAGLAEAIQQQLAGGAARQVPVIVPVSRASELPLSYAQQRLWFIQQLEPQSAAYNMAFAARLTGALQVTGLAQALEHLLLRHEALRTCYPTSGGVATQRINESAQLDLAHDDLTGLASQERQAEAAAIVRRQAGRPFDLEAGPVVRARLIRVEESKHVLALCVHHIAGDGWSMGVLIKEMSHLYEQYSRGGQSELEELEVQYADYAVWQREWLEGEEVERQLGYWRERLAGARAVRLPADHVRRSAASYAAATQEVKIAEEVTGRLKGMSRREGVTLFMSLIGGLVALISRTTGEREVTVGTPVAGRRARQAEGLVGMMVNTVVLRVEVRQGATVREMLREVREAGLGAYANQDVAYERVVEEVVREREGVEEGLYGVMAALQNVKEEEMRMAGVEVEEEVVEAARAKGEMVLTMRERGGEMECVMEYAREVYEEESVRRMLRQYVRMVEGMSEGGGMRKVGELEMMSEEERRQVVEEWNETGKEYDRSRSIAEIFEKEAAKRPDAIALVYGNERLSYGELNASANRLANHLLRQNVGAEAKVGVCIPHSTNMVITLLGVLKAGAAYVPLDPTYPKERLTFLLQDSRAKLLITEQKLADSFMADGLDFVLLDRDWATISRESEQLAANPVTSDNLAYVIYTSGSTGVPKGVGISHRAVCNRLLWEQRAYPMSDSDRAVALSSINFDASVPEIFTPLISGAQLILPEPGGHKDAAYLVDMIARHGVTIITLVPSMLQVLLEDPELRSCHTLERVYCGGEAMTARLRERFFACLSARLINLYGPTETAVDATHKACGPGNALGSESIGRPLDNVKVYVLDCFLNPVPVGVAGEIYVAGEGLAWGYVNRPELTAEPFIPDPFSSDEAGRMYRTGDLGRFLRDGNIDYLGRADHQVKIRGRRIELGEIESVLGRHANVKDIAVEARDFADGDKRLVAYLVSRGDQKTTPGDLRAYLKGKLPDFMLPASYVWLKALPTTSNGKLDRRALPEPDGSLFSEQEYIAPDGPIEDLLAGVWRDLLKVDRVGVYDNFFELGGHSLLLTQLASRIKTSFSVDLPLGALFEAPNIRDLSVAIAAEQVATADAAQVARMLEEIRHLSPSEIRLILQPGSRADFALEDL